MSVDKGLRAGGKSFEISAGNVAYAGMTLQTASRGSGLRPEACLRRALRVWRHTIAKAEQPGRRQTSRVPNYSRSECH
jgi:hypothetical protein